MVAFFTVDGELEADTSEDVLSDNFRIYSYKVRPGLGLLPPLRGVGGGWEQGGAGRSQRAPHGYCPRVRQAAPAPTALATRRSATRTLGSAGGRMGVRLQVGCQLAELQTSSARWPGFRSSACNTRRTCAHPLAACCLGAQRGSRGQRERMVHGRLTRAVRQACKSGTPGPSAPSEPSVLSHGHVGKVNAGGVVSVGWGLPHLPHSAT